MRAAVHVTYEVAASDIGERLDKWLTEHLQEDELDVSRNIIQQWIKDGLVTRHPAGRIKPSDPVEDHQRYEVNIPEEEPFVIVPDDVPFDVVYEDGDVVVIDKPRGIVVHPGAGNPRKTVVNGLAARGISLSALGGEMRPGVVHRIDKDTSGLVMFAKTDKAYYSLTEQLRSHSVERLYLAIVHGKLTHREGTIEMPIARDPKDRQKMTATLTGKRAVTHFQVIEQFEQYAYISCRLETGRTHQIRVHLAAIGHPLVGDVVYGRRHTLPIDGQALHAHTLGFTHPTSGEQLRFTSDIPEDMSSLLEHLQAGRMG